MRSRLPNLTGTLIASRWWERLVALTYWARRRPMVRQGVPPIGRRWIPPAR